MTTDQTPPDPPTPQPLGRFDASAERKRLDARVQTNPMGNGYIAVVVDLGAPDARLDDPRELYNSQREFANRGVFPNHESAQAHAQRWVDARLKQLERKAYLRRTRQAALAERLERNCLRVDEIRDEIKALNGEKKEIEHVNRKLVQEARSPQVEIDFSPDAADFRIFDGASWTDGTQDRDDKQTELPLEQADGDEGVEAEAEADDQGPGTVEDMRRDLGIPEGSQRRPAELTDDDGEPPEGRKLPAKVKGSDGKWVKPGVWVSVPGLGYSGEVTEIDRFLKGDAFGLVVRTDDGTLHHVANHQVHRIRKPPKKKRKGGGGPAPAPEPEPPKTDDDGGAEARPGLDPGAVFWPDSDDDRPPAA